MTSTTSSPGELLASILRGRSGRTRSWLRRRCGWWFLVWFAREEREPSDPGERALGALPAMVPLGLLLLTEEIEEHLG